VHAQRASFGGALPSKKNGNNMTLIFDFDGTIADSFPAVVKITNTYARENNIKPLTEQNIDVLRKQGTKALIDSLNIPMYKLPFLIGNILNNLGKEIRTVNPCLGVKDVLEKLHSQGYRLGIVTSNYEKNVQAFLEHNNLELFDFIYSGKSLFGKHIVLKNLLREHKLDASKTVYIGDEIRDIEAARKSGIKIVSVAWGYNDSALLAKHSPDFLCSSTEDLFVSLTTRPSVI
jgi:phosphoglycolate phosphatase